MTRFKEIREAVAPSGDASLGLGFRRLSTSRLVTIAQIEGRVRGAGREFVLACDMRFAARESAMFGQFEPALGVIPGAGAIQLLTRLIGRGRALEVMLSAEDYDADSAERYGWINRALPAAHLGEFVRSRALRIASFPSVGHVAIKDRVNAIALVPLLVSSRRLALKLLPLPRFLVILPVNHMRINFVGGGYRCVPVGADTAVSGTLASRCEQCECATSGGGTARPAGSCVWERRRP